MRLTIAHALPALCVCSSLTSLARGQDANLPAQPIPVLPAPQQASPPTPLPGAPPSFAAPVGPPTAQIVPPSMPPDMPPPPAVYVETPPPPPRHLLVYEPLGVWFDADFLLWWTKESHIPALRTPGFPGDLGVLVPSSPQTLYSGGDADEGPQVGGRFTLGLWLQESQVLGLEGSYFFLSEHGHRLARGEEESALIDAPPGTYLVTQSSLLQSAEFNAIANLGSCGDVRYLVLAGFRYLQLDEKLRVEQNFVTSDFAEEDSWDDEFQAHNHFYGGQIGGRAEYRWERLVVNVNAKLALGVNNQRVAIDGGLTRATFGEGVNDFGDPVQTVHVTRYPGGGLLADPVAYRRNYFAVVPEIGFDVGYQFTRYCRGSIGYNFLYWSSVVRAGDQVVNIPKATDFWAQGLTFNLGFNF